MTTLLSAKAVLDRYTNAYRQLYNRSPRDLKVIDHEWVVVNGARMRVAELDYLTQQLQLEYSQGLAEKRSVINRLVRWLKR